MSGSSVITRTHSTFDLADDHIVILPLEIWSHVFEMIQKLGFLLKDCLSFALTCHEFHSIFSSALQRKWTTRSFLPLFFQTLNFSSALCVDTCPKISPIASTDFKDGCLKFIAADSKGRSYFSFFSELYIFNPTEQIFFSCELYQDTREEGIIRENVMDQQMQFEIEACYPNEDGFVLITRGWIYIWTYTNEKPNQVSKLSPFNNEDNAPHIKSTAVIQNSLFLYCFPGNRSCFLCKLDLKEENPVLVEVKPSYECLGGYISAVGNRLVFFKSTRYAYLTPPIENDVVNELPEIIEKKVPHIFSEPICVWRNSTIINEHFSVAFAFDLETEKVSSWEINYKFKGLQSLRYYVEKDFLFIMAGTIVKAIYLPTKKDFSDALSSILKNYWKMDDLTLLYLTIDESALHLFFESTDHSLKHVHIPYTIDHLPRSLIDGEMDASPPVKHFVAEPNTSCAKITFLASCILFLLTIALGATLINLHPGAVIYEGSGLLLTLPAVLVISIGGSTTLVLIAIGSYSWWKAKKVPKLLEIDPD